MRLLVCGNFGDELSAPNGQTIKTRVLAKALQAAIGEELVDTLDTSRLHKRPMRFYAAARRKCTRASQVILLPGPRGVRVLLSLFLRWRGHSERDVRYVVIGGWLPELVAKSRRLRETCGKLDGIYVETRAMADTLRALGLRNVNVTPNFRSFDRHMERRYAPATSPLKLVFCARVFKEKGIEDAVAAVEQLNRRSGRPVVQLDVYGPIESGYRSRFRQLLNGSNATTYKGVIDPADIYAALQPYDLMVFPTYYSDEGFPGTIIDAFIAGVPVLAADWRYNREFVEDGRTGALHVAKSPEHLADRLEDFTRAPERLAAMRMHCIDESRQYHVDVALRGLLHDMSAAEVRRNGR
jgi:glycosyltransferase involved in cell wall biosynthesis